MQSGYGSVTLEVTPREAELLVFADQARGKLTLALRNDGDVSFEATMDPIDFNQLKDSLPALNAERQRKIRSKL